mgnify:CR=1 FL=1
MLSLPVAAAPDLCFDLRPQKEHLRMVGKDLAAMLPPPGAQLGIIDPKGNGLAALMVRYELTKDSTTGKAPSVHNLGLGRDRDDYFRGRNLRLLRGNFCIFIWSL